MLASVLVLGELLIWPLSMGSSFQEVQGNHCVNYPEERQINNSPGTGQICGAGLPVSSDPVFCTTANENPGDIGLKVFFSFSYKFGEHL